MRVLVPMAGPNELFKESGYAYPKNLIEIQGRPLIEHVYQNLNSITAEKFIFIINKEEMTRFHLDNVLKLLNPTCSVIAAESNTKGAACSALLAIEEINDDEPLLIANGDQIIFEDLQKIIAKFRNEGLDGGIVTFNSVHPRWSYIRVDENGLVIEAAEKRPISKLATAGLYYFKKGKDFIQAVMNMIRKDAHVNGNFYICPVYNELILRQFKIGHLEIPRQNYFSLTDPQSVQVYEEYLSKKKEKE
jgi:dTDP-glucose pyrophosphorylase